MVGWGGWLVSECDVGRSGVAAWGLIDVAVSEDACSVAPATSAPTSRRQPPLLNLPSLQLLASKAACQQAERERDKYLGKLQEERGRARGVYDRAKQEAAQVRGGCALVWVE